MFKTLKASETLGWYGTIGITGINGIPVFTPPPGDVTTAVPVKGSDPLGRYTIPLRS